MKIAFLGLGRMGSAMASRLVEDKTLSLVVWNRSADKAKPLTDLGATAAADPAEAIAGAEIVMTSLLDDASIEALFHEGSPALAAMRLNAIHLGLTTISPDCGNRLQALHAAHGTRYVSGPVLGRPDAAAKGALVQFLAGDASALVEVEAATKAFAVRTVPLPGLAGAANSQKLCVNFFLACLLESMSECYTLGDALGVSREALAAFFAQSFAHPGLKGYAERMNARQGDSVDGFAMTAGLKDVRLIREAAAKVNCPVDVADLVAGKMEDAVARGMGGQDWSAVQEISRLRAGLPSQAV